MTTIRVKKDLRGLERAASDAAKRGRLTTFSQRVAFLSREFVPWEENTLKNSEPLHSKYDKGVLIWDTPYAAKQYYVPQNHPRGGTDHWVEAMVARRSGELESFAEALYEGDFSK